MSPFSLRFWLECSPLSFSHGVAGRGSFFLPLRAVRVMKKPVHKHRGRELAFRVRSRVKVGRSRRSALNRDSYASNMTSPYVDSWEEFAKAAERIYSQSPWKTRFCVKYRHCDGALVLKITDDKTCVKYQTDQLQDVKKLEKLNSVLMRNMVARS
ncbi:Signal recognition particle 9 kDa protein [Geodia barretti]|uniref:Signal recognition particle 9 kDa protein n=1 Tax=Geodia barretti TaxID=519541 RepID=A0AA35T8P1_GEOBA|nr:Signal recognition particle 9 kDa protein [Geodia barretti]